ncbi:hypothetical protein OsccyDRAFT_0695 [Leptolyngbyaceae cyanobacterium JSC-12]|nr:hypothetical protein OsccyDRAFT_0695 [Leptolyngbyaceae cyanobacterium JSC-12]
MNDLIYRRHPNFERSVELTGTDLAIKAKEDLVTQQGDAATISGVDLIVESLLRRLNTPTNGYRRWVRTPDGMEVVDSSYGNRAFDYLSSPTTPATIAEIERAFKETVEAEPQVELVSIKVKQAANFTDIDVVINYRILSEQELRALSITLNPA